MVLSLNISTVHFLKEWCVAQPWLTEVRLTLVEEEARISFTQSIAPVCKVVQRIQSSLINVNIAVPPGRTVKTVLKSCRRSTDTSTAGGIELEDLEQDIFRARTSSNALKHLLTERKLVCCFALLAMRCMLEIDHRRVHVVSPQE